MDKRRKWIRGGEHEYVERSEQRKGYRSRKAERRRRGAATVLKLTFASLLCAVCYPLGLIALWTCRAKPGIKFILTIATAVCFFALASVALNIKTDSAAYTRLQSRCVVALTHVQEQVQADLYAAGQAAKAFPSFAEKAFTVTQQWTVRALPRAQANFWAVFTKDGAVAGKAKETVAQTLWALQIVPTPAPTAAPVAAPTLAPRATANPITTVWRVAGERVMHTDPNCAQAQGARETPYAMALTQGWKQCPLCFTKATEAFALPQSATTSVTVPPLQAPAPFTTSAAVAPPQAPAPTAQLP